MGTIIPILLLICVSMSIFIILPTIFIINYAKNHTSERKEIQNQIEQENKDIFDNGIWFPVKYATSKRFKKIFKLFPWEATGILFIDSSKIIFFSKFLMWENLRFEIPLQETKFNLIGKNIWPNGLSSWIALDLSTNTHYFTPETGTFVFGLGQRKATEDMYKKILDYLKINS